MGNHVSLKDMSVGMPIDCDYILASHLIKQTQQQKDFIDATLQDKNGQIHCNQWDTNGAENLTDDSIVHVVGTVTEYKGTLQIKATSIVPRDIDEVDLTDLLPVAPRDGLEMFNELYDMAKNFKNEDLRALTCHILQQRKDKLLKTPGGKSMHHAVINGLLYHTTRMVETAAAISKVYPEINAELLEAGAMLHDIGKTEEFDVGPLGLVKDYTNEGGLETHVFIGAHYVANMCDLLHLSAETKLLMTHMLLSHHGVPVHGSLVHPMFAEASLLNKIDEIDSRMDIYMRAEKTAEPGKMTDRGVYGLADDTNLRVYHPSFR